MKKNNAKQRGKSEHIVMASILGIALMREAKMLDHSSRVNLMSSILQPFIFVGNIWNESLNPVKFLGCMYYIILLHRRYVHIMNPRLHVYCIPIQGTAKTQG